MLDDDKGAGRVRVDYTYIAKRDGKYFKINLSGEYASSGFCNGLDCKDFSNVKRLFDQILSTFQFIE